MSRVECGDSIRLIKTVASESVHLILSDIPYGINYEEIGRASCRERVYVLV